MKPIYLRNCVLPDGREGSVLIKEGRIEKISVGSSPEIQGALTFDAGGGSLLPGLVDTHCHPFEYGWLKRSVDLRGVGNITGLRLRLGPRVKRALPGEWVTGMGWDQETMSDMRMPEKTDIDDLSPSNPVVLTRVCGHIALLNSKAIEVLGLSARHGVEYERGAGGELTGILKESALESVYKALPRSVQRSGDDLLSVEFEAARFGLTELHCIISPEGFKEELEALFSLDASGSLGLMYAAFIPPEAIGFVEERGYRKKASKARIAGVKVYTDGSLGARTAALREPYSDDPRNQGVLRCKDAELASMVEKADRAGLRLAIHAIGDRAIEQALEALAPYAGDGNPLGHRIEHASLLPPDLLSKMAAMKIRATVQPMFITSDTWATKRLGEDRALYLYPLKSMHSAGIITSGSSDSPVESM